MLLRPGICLAFLLSTGIASTFAQRSERGEPAEPAKEQKEPERLKIGSVAGLPRPEGFIVEDLRSPEMKSPTLFKQTYKAPFSPFKPPVPLARYERTIGDAELSVSPVDLLTEKLIERYGDRLAGKRLKVHEFTYGLEQVINKQQGIVFIPLDPASVAIAVIGSVAGTAMMRGKGIDLRLRVKIDAELDDRRIEAAEAPMTLGAEDGPARLTRYAIDKFLYRIDQQEGDKPAEPAPAAPKAD
jgi:hypothetical protein